MNFTPSTAVFTGSMQPGSARYTAAALRSLINELRAGTVRHPDDADRVLTHLEEQLGIPVTHAVEPPVADWDVILPPAMISSACQQLRLRINDSKFGRPDWDAADRLLDCIEDRQNWPRSHATEPGVQRDAAGRKL